MQFAARERRLPHVAGSMAPSPLPAPTMVCSSSIKRMTWTSCLARSLSTAFRRSSNSPRNFAPAISAPISSARMRLFLKPLRDFGVDDALCESLHNRGLAHARFADQHGDVLGAPLPAPGWCGGFRCRDRSPDRACPRRRGGKIDGALLECLTALLGVGHPATFSPPRTPRSFSTAPRPRRTSLKQRRASRSSKAASTNSSLEMN